MSTPATTDRRPASSHLLAATLATLATIAVAATGLTSRALAAECSNEAIRQEQGTTSLPECRAYELVSNQFKEGFAPREQSYTDDGAFSYESAGNFADNGLSGGANEYLATRSAAGWQTTAPGPSGSTYDGNSYPNAVSTDLRSSAWQLRGIDESTNVFNLYLRGPDGVLTRIGPGVNPATIPPGVPGTTHTGVVVNVVNASADLSHVLFTVVSSEVYPGIVPGQSSNLYEYAGTGNERPEYVAVDNVRNQIATGAESCANGISPEGRVVFFTVGCGGSGITQVWTSIYGHARVQASASQCTRTAADLGGVCNAPAGANFAGAALGGSRVYFTTTQQLLNGDIDQTNDLYECDIPPGDPPPVGLANPCASLTEVSHSATGAEVENVVNVSEDGSRVYFVAKGVLAGNLATDDATAVAGDNNLYVWEKDAAHPAGQTTFVSRLDSDDVTGAQSTADGRYLVFTTANQLLPSDTDEAQDVYRYDADTGVLLRVSTDSSGTGGNEPGLGASTATSPTFTNRSRTIMTSHGGTVVFQTDEALSPADTNGQLDVYAWREGVLSLISSGRPYLESPSPKFMWITASGTDIYFNTTAQLAPNDGDSNNDVYDARIGGGFSFAAPQQCSGEACLRRLAPTPQTFARSGTAEFSGAGNLKASAAPPAPKPALKPVTRAQKMAKALKACKSKHNKKKRAACKHKARATYGKGK